MSIDWDSIAAHGGIGKGPTRKQVKAKKDRSEADVIKSVRAEVFALDLACVCGDCPPADTDEMHEVVPRSKTRGLPPEQRFNRRNCVRVSRQCHHEITGPVGGRRKWVTFDNVLTGADGTVRVRRKDGRETVYQRRGHMKTISKPVTTKRDPKIITGKAPVTK